MNDQRMKEDHIPGFSFPVQPVIGVVIFFKIRKWFPTHFCVNFCKTTVFSKGCGSITLFPVMGSLEKTYSSLLWSDTIKRDPDGKDVFSLERPVGEILVERSFFLGERFFDQQLVIKKTDTIGFQNLCCNCWQGGMTHEFFKIGITTPEEEISIVTAFFSLRSVFHGCASGMVENPLNGFTHGRNPFLVQYPTDDRSTVFMVFPDCRFCFIADLNWVRL